MIRVFEKKDNIRCMDIVRSSIRKKVSYSKDVKDFIVSYFLKEEYLERKSKETKFFVYELDGLILGMGCLDKDQIERMYVDPVYSGQGIGSQLLKHLEGISRDDGFKRITLHSFDNSIDFYKKHGYEIMGLFEYSFPDNNISFNTSIMQKDI